MVNKKEEYNALEKLSEKDLWCQDLDAFVEEWENQLREDQEMEKDIRSRGRRASKKIGAGKTTSRRVKKEDDDFNPSKSKAAKAAAAKAAQPNPAKGIAKIEHKSHKGFLEMFQAKPKPKTTSGLGSDGAEEASGMSDDDFAELAAVKPSKQTSRAPSEQPGPTNGRVKRTAAAAPKKWVDDDEESESDDGKFLGDVGDMVKGIGGGDANGRLSLFAMSASRQPSNGDRPTSSAGLPKLKSKASRVFDVSDGDETNYEMLAKSSPHKAAPQPKTDLDSFLSDEDEDLVPITKKVPVKSAPAPTKPVVKRGPKPKAAPVAEKPAPVEPKALSPAAKAYAAKQSKLNLKQNVFSDDEDSDIEMSNSPAPKVALKPKAKAPARKNVISDDESDVEMHDPPPPAKAPAKGKVISDDEMEMSDSPPPKPAAKAKAPAKPAAKPAKKQVVSDDEMGMGDSPPPKPAAKAKAPAKPAAKPAKPAKKQVVSDDEDDDLEEAPKPAAGGRGRPARAAVVKAKKVAPVYIDSEDDEDMDEDDDLEASVVVEEEDESEDFDESE